MRSAHAHRTRAMSDEGGPLTAIADILVSVFGPSQPKQPKAPSPPSQPMAPHELYTLWTVLATGLLAVCVYVPIMAALLSGRSPGAMVGKVVAEFLRAPLNPPAALVVWFIAVTIGVAYLLLGLRHAAEGPHAGLSAFWSAALPIVGFVVLGLHAPWIFADPFIFGGCLVIAAMFAMRFYLAIRGQSARRTVQRNIQRKNLPLQSARPRRRWWQII
jgi:hypothetical protein